MRVYVSAQNLLYLWSDGYRGINPEARYASGVYRTAMARNDLRLYFSGDNLFTVTGLHGYYDPEALGDTGDKMGKVYPLSRTYSVGMNINF